MSGTLTDMLALIDQYKTQSGQLQSWLTEAALLIPEDQRAAFLGERGLVLPPQAQTSVPTGGVIGMQPTEDADPKADAAPASPSAGAAEKESEHADST